MATSDISVTTLGIGTNPGLLFPACDYKAAEGQIVNNNDYLYGKAIRCTNEGQKVMETQWLPEGTVSNIVTPCLFIQGIGATSNLDYMSILVYKRNPRTSETFEPQELRIKYRQYISDTVGAVPYYHMFNRTAGEYRFFDPRYEYKFVVIGGSITTGGVLDIEALYLQYHERNGIVGSRQVSWTAPADGSRPAEAIPYIEGISWVCKSDGAGLIDITAPVEMYIPGVGGWSGYWGTVTSGTYYGDLDADGTIEYPGCVRGMPNAVDAIITGFAYGSGVETSNQIQTDIAPAPYGGGYVMSCYVTGLAANTLYYFYTVLYGYQNARQI